MKTKRLVVVVGISACCCAAQQSVTADGRPYFLSEQDADERFEKAIEALQNTGRPVHPVNPRLLPPPSLKHQQSVAGVRKSWDKSFANKGKVIDLQAKPPPPPNGLFKAAKKGGFVKKPKSRKTSGKRTKKRKKR